MPRVDAHADAGWIGYSVPVVDGERVMCCFNSGTRSSTARCDGQACCGMCSLEPSLDGTTMTSRPQPGQPAGAVKLEGADTMVVLFRVVNRQVERVRVFSEDCQLDAGGREVTWLTGVKPAESIALLESLVVAQPRPNGGIGSPTAPSARSPCTRTPRRRQPSSGCSPRRSRSRCGRRCRSGWATRADGAASRSCSGSSRTIPPSR